MGWGSTYGAITAAVSRLQAKGESVACVHLRYLNPLPADLGEVLSRYERVLVPELNLGQLLHVLRDRYLVDAQGLTRSRGCPSRSPRSRPASRPCSRGGGADMQDMD